MAGHQMQMIRHYYETQKKKTFVFNAIFQAIDNNPNRFLGWVFVNPRGEKDQVQELDNWKNHPGFIGVKAHPFWHRYEPIELLPVAEQLSKNGKPLLIHAGYGSHGNYDILLKKLPLLILVKHGPDLS